MFADHVQGIEEVESELWRIIADEKNWSLPTSLPMYGSKP